MRPLALLGTALLASCASAPRDFVDRLRPVANPSQVVATELEFARAAQEEGQWTAFREYAANGAVMFVPQRVDAQQWLKRQTEPAQAVQWQPHEVWSSCDGSVAVTRGAAQWPDGTLGDFLTIWQRQNNGEYRWVADLGQSRIEALPKPDFVRTTVATCNPAVPQDYRVASSEGSGAVVGQARDGTLQYRIAQPAGGQVVKLILWNGAAFEDAFTAVFGED